HRRFSLAMRRVPSRLLSWVLVLVVFASIRDSKAAQGCVEIVERNVPNAIVTKSVRVCLKGCKSGTEIRITCKEFYYFKNADYAHGQLLTCRNGKWLNKRNIEEAPGKCLAGCEVLTNDDMMNATYILQPPQKSYPNGNKHYWSAGTRIRTKCKPGFAFDYPAWRRIGMDDYKCIGGQIGWQRKIGSLVSMGGVDGRPGLCKPLCNALDPLNDYAPGTRAVAKPGKDGTVTIDGKNYVYDRFLYVFKCEPGLNFAKSGPHFEAGQQELVCRGGAEGYYDVQTQQINAQPVECTKPGCASFMRHLDKNATVSKVGKRCRSLNSNSIPTGCQATIKCSQFHYFEKSAYGNGQVLTCTDKGWRDQNNEAYNVNEPAKCGWGCRALAPDADMSNATYEGDGPPTNENLIFQNGDEKYWASGVKVTTRCKKGFVRQNPRERNEPYSFVCRGGSEGWLNLATGRTNVKPGGCEAVCAEVKTMPEGTVIKRRPKLKVSFDGVDHIMPGAIYIFQCAEGYDYPASAPYAKDKQQEVYCSGGASGYRDMTTGAFNAKPYPCQKSGAEGCDPIGTSNSDIILDKSRCILQEGKMPKGCTLEIRCKLNYYPRNMRAIDARTGVQKLQCVGGNDGWVNVVDGSKNATPLACLPGCEMISSGEMKNAALVTQISSTSIIFISGKKLMRRGAEATFRCINGYVMESEAERDQGAVKFVCEGGPDKWRNTVTGRKGVQPIQCLSTCPAFPDPPKGTIFASYPDQFFENGGMRVIQNAKYEFKCAKGYHYPNNTAHSQSGRQKMICHANGNLDGYYDPDTEKYNAKMVRCVRGEMPGCTKISKQSPPPHTKVLQMEGCSLANGKTAIGCVVQLQCEDGFFTTQDWYTDGGTQELICVDDGEQSVWKDKNHNSVAEFIQCQPGCQRVPMRNSIVIKDAQIFIRNAAKQFFQPGAMMTIKCSTGTLTATGNVEEAGRSRDFQCRGGNEGWLDVATGASERWPGESCKNTCLSISGEEGFSFKQQPASFEIDNIMKVLEGSKYIIKCKEGYHYVDGVHEAENQQVLICGSNGRYLDRSNANLISAEKQVNEAAKCVKNVGPGCRDIVQQNALISERTCNGASIDGCSLVVTCKPGFIPGEKAYLASGVQRLRCVNGNDWVDQNGAIVLGAFNCVPACLQPPTTNGEVSVERNSSSTITVNKYVYVLPGGTIDVTCKDGFVWTATSNKRRLQTVHCVGGDKNWKNDEAENIDIADEACTGICPLQRLSLPDNTRLVQNATFFEYHGETYALGKTSFVFECKPGYVYAEGSAHYQARKQTVRCNPDTRKFEDVEAHSTTVKLEGCIRPPNANECKEIMQNAVSTQVNVQKCNKDGDFYSTGCTITVQCKPGFYPEDSYLKVVTQQLRCGPSGSGWTDQFNKVITGPLRCTRGCLPRLASTNTTMSTNTVVTMQNTIYVLPDGATAKCSMRESVVNVKRNVMMKTEDYHPFYCADNASRTDNSSKSIDFDDSCVNCCAAIKNLPKGVELFKRPYEFVHNGKTYAFMSKPYVFKCKPGFTYAAGTMWAQKGRQALMCSGQSHMYEDLDTGAKNARLEACEELKGCREIHQREDMTVVLEGCVTSGDIYTAGCRIKIMCPTTPQQYPSNSNYLKDGYQRLTCRSDGSGWVDQFGAAITAPMGCTLGCIPRPAVSSAADRNSNAWNLTVRINGVELTCISGSSSVTVKKKIREDDHGFYCKVSSRSLTHDDQATFADRCTNACFAFEHIPDSVVVKQRPWRLFDFKGKTNFIVPFNGIYEFECKDAGSYFANTNRATKRRLQCDGKTSTYTELDTGEKNVTLTPCIQGNGMRHSTVINTSFIHPSANNINNSFMSNKWMWQQGNDWQQGSGWQPSAPWQQGTGWQQGTELRGIAICALPRMSDDDTKTVFRDENCINAEKETVGCSIRIDCEQGYILNGIKQISMATAQIKCQSNGMWIDEISQIPISNVNDLGCVPARGVPARIATSSGAQRCRTLNFTKNRGEVVKARRICTGARFEQAYCQYDIQCVNGIIGITSTNRASIFCEQNGRWRLKHSSILVDSAKLLRCKSGISNQRELCKAGNLVSDGTRLIKKRRRCNRLSRQPYGCQVDIVCPEGLLIRWNNHTSNRVSAVCERNGRWRLKSGQLSFVDLNNLRCRPALEDDNITSVLSVMRRRKACKPIRLKNPERGIVKRSAACAKTDDVGCIYSIECINGYVIEANDQRSQHLLLVCGNDLKWREEMTFAIIEEVDELDCKPGDAGKLSGCKGGAIASDESKRVRKRKRCTKENRQPYQCQIDVTCLDGFVIGGSRTLANQANMVCQRNGEWKEKHTDLLIRNIDELVCQPGITINGTELSTCPTITLDDGRGSTLRTVLAGAPLCSYDIHCSHGYVVVQTNNEQMQMMCEPNSTKCKDVGTGTVFSFVDTLRCVPAMGTKPITQKWIECDVVELHDSEGQKIKRRRRCKGKGRESSGCQYDITCSSGFILNVDGMKAVRMSIVCDSNGKWKEKHSKVVITELNKLRCTPVPHRNNKATQPSPTNITQILPGYNVRKRCTPIIPHSDVSRKLQVTGECHSRFSIGCQYNITCHKGYVMKRSKDDVDKLVVECENNGKWIDRSTGLVVDDVNELVCVPGNGKDGAKECEGVMLKGDEKKLVKKRRRCTGNHSQPADCQYDVKCTQGLVININELKADRMSVVCGRDGRWREKQSNLLINDVNALDCVKLNVVEKGSCMRAFTRSDERKSVMRTSQCNTWNLRGCQYRVNCRRGNGIC
uniref:Sushi domain-containing protein n=2 Tax=Parascaris univalens TaxID=6257 RepID=A0A915CIY1_PARUN